MSGIHTVQTRPFPLMAAVWDPEDVYQRGLVLGWLTTFYGPNAFWFEYGVKHGGLHLNFAASHIYVAPKHVVVLDPETGVLKVFSPEVYEALFDYVAPVVDPNQPALFDLPVVAITGLHPDAESIFLIG